MPSHIYIGVKLSQKFVWSCHLGLGRSNRSLQHLVYPSVSLSCWRVPYVVNKKNTYVLKLSHIIEDLFKHTAQSNQRICSSSVGRLFWFLKKKSTSFIFTSAYIRCAHSGTAIALCARLRRCASLHHALLSSAWDNGVSEWVSQSVSEWVSDSRALVIRFH